MKISNMYGYQSQSLIDALISDNYDLKEKPENVFSLTEVIDAPKAKVLWRRHEDEVTMDVSDRIHTLMGSAKHWVLEQSNKRNGRLSEERLYIDVTSGLVHTLPDPKEGEKIIDQLKKVTWYHINHYYVSCKIDVYDHIQKCLEDYKCTSVYKVQRGCDADWEAQVNCGGFGMRMIGFEVTKVRIVVFIDGWKVADLESQENSAARKGVKCKYPIAKAKEFNDVRVWSNEECLNYLRNRVQLHVAAQSLTDDKIPVCTLEERWYRGESFAIIKEGLKVAKKVIKCDDYENREQAYETAKIVLGEYQAEKPKDAALFSIQTRPGNDGRCNGRVRYCHVCQWCNYWQETYKDKVAVETEY